MVRRGWPGILLVALSLLPGGGLRGEDPVLPPPAPATMEDIIAQFDESHRQVAALVRGMTDALLSETTKFMIWLNRNKERLIIRQIIGANEKWVWKHYYTRQELNDHKDHVHIGWGIWY